MFRHRLLRSRVLFTVICGATAIGCLSVADSVNRPADRVARGLTGVDTTKRSRVLVLLIDGLRRETATDAQMMPILARLRATGASGEVDGAFEGFSIPSIRAALSGKAEAQLMNAIENFHFTALPVESVFLDLRRAGKSSLVVGVDPFVQFGSVFETRLPVEGSADQYTLDRERPEIALSAYARERFDLIICHYEGGDWTGHEVGVRAPRYAAEYAFIDSLIGRFAAARKPDDYLVVFGDHGQSETGQHKTGLSVPTFGLFIGPDVTPGVVFRPLPIANIRLILSHALGLELHQAPYQVAELSRFLPLAPTREAAAALAPPHASRDLRDYALFALFLVAGTVILMLAIDGGSMPAATSVWWLIAAVFVAELLAQRLIDASWSAFPFLAVVAGATMTRRHWRSAAAVMLIGAYFATRFVYGAHDGGLLRVPLLGAELAPLYAAGSVAKLFLVLTLTGWKRPVRAAVVTLALSLVEFRVWDTPWVFLGAIAVALAAYRLARSDVDRALAIAAFGYVVLYFTLRLPLFEYAWIDLFLAAVLLARRHADPRWTDALVISGAFTLTSVWLDGGLEWGFLYSVLPADVVEFKVGWMLPMILLKLPLLLLLNWWVTRTAPTRAFVAAMFAYTGLRFAAVWIVRLAGASGEAMWPLAEQGTYLLTFAIATVWVYRARHTAQPPAARA
ncbi:MAG: alkaline phosphatase family protein [Gemmatimonadetes bacterium]|nr:alkaline phosphatase family protein [Gemmatimonadota bacterium]